MPNCSPEDLWEHQRTQNSRIANPNAAPAPAPVPAPTPASAPAPPAAPPPGRGCPRGAPTATGPRSTGTIAFTVIIKAAGTYLLRVRYANGSGPINTDNKCAIRSLRIDGVDAATVVLPQRGSWSSWGASNAIIRSLKSGPHTIELFYDAGDANMNGKVNDALIDRLDVVRYR